MKHWEQIPGYRLQAIFLLFLLICFSSLCFSAPKAVDPGSVVNESDFYQVKLSHGNIRSEKTLYATFDYQRNKYVVVCDSGQKEEAELLCRSALNDVALKRKFFLAKATRASSFTARQFIDSHWLLGALSPYIFRSYSLDVSQVLLLISDDTLPDSHTEYQVESPEATAPQSVKIRKPQETGAFPLDLKGRADDLPAHSGDDDYINRVKIAGLGVVSAAGAGLLAYAYFRPEQHFSTSYQGSVQDHPGSIQGTGYQGPVQDHPGSIQGTGLINGGNYCFLNSSLQFLYADREFRKIVRYGRLLHPGREITSENLITFARKNLYTAIDEIFSEMDQSNPDLYKIQELKQTLSGNFELAKRIPEDIDQDRNFPLAFEKAPEPFNEKSQKSPDSKENETFFLSPDLYGKIQKYLHYSKNYGTILFPPGLSSQERQIQESAQDFWAELVDLANYNPYHIKVHTELSLGTKVAIRAEDVMRPYIQSYFELTYTHPSDSVKNFQDLIDLQLFHFNTTSSPAEVAETELEFIDGTYEMAASAMNPCTARGNKGCFGRKVLVTDKTIKTIHFAYEMPSRKGRCLERELEVNEVIKLPYKKPGRGMLTQKMKLTSVMVSTGSVASGHWYTYVRQNAGWVKFNDSHDPELVHWKNIRDDIRKHGMVLRYEKIKMPVREKSAPQFRYLKNPFVRDIR